MTTKNVIWMVSQVSDRNNHLAFARTITNGSSYVSADNLQGVLSWATFDIGARYNTTLAEHLY